MRPMPIKDPEIRRTNHARYMREVWYPKNRQKHIAAVHKNRDEQRDVIRLLIAEHKTCCKICGENERVCLDFHHVDPSKKHLDISQMYRAGWSKRRILDEIAKCVILCSNCHRKYHAGLIDAGMCAGGHTGLISQ